MSADSDDDEEASPQGQQLPPGLPPGLQEFFRNFGGRGAPQAPHGAVPMRGQGSGFIISPDGYILTNAHVVENADRVTVRLTDRREFRAKVVGKDHQTDVALIKIDAKDLPIVKTIADRHHARVELSRSERLGGLRVAVGFPPRPVALDS